MPNLRSHVEPVGRAPRLPEYPLEPQSCPQGQAASFAGPHPDRAQGAPSAGFSWPFGLLCASTPGFAGLEQASSPVHEESHPMPYICLFQSFGGSCTACTDRWGHARAWSHRVSKCACVTVAAQRFSSS